jgi:D-alanine-D-alanine ligase
MTIGVLFGGPSPEHDISILTGLQAAHVLTDGGRDVACVYWTKAGEWLRVEPDLEAKAFLDPNLKGSPLELQVPGGFVERKRMRGTAELALDVVVNVCHGGPGEDGTLTGLLTLAGLRVTGPTAAAAALAMDKLATAGAALATGIPTIETVSLRADTEGIALPAPWVVKPRFGGSSLGVEVGVEDLDTARALAASGVNRAGAVAQQFLDGWVDLNIAARVHPTLELSAIERPLREDGAIYDYRSKYLAGGEGMESAPRELPAQIPASIEEQVRAHAVRIVDTFGLTGIPRIDFLWDGADRVVLCEVNTIPGALGLYLWRAGGHTALEILDALVDEARQAPARPHQWASTTDGAALRVAGSVAAKLA